MPTDPRKQLWITEWEAGLLAYLLAAYDRKNSLLKQIRYLIRMFDDDSERLRELVKRANANAFWINGMDRIKPRIQKLRSEAKKNHRKVEEEIAHLSTEKVKKIVDKKARKKS